MPNWKKLIVSGSDAGLNSLTVDTYVSASSFSGNFTGSLQGTSSWALTASYVTNLPQNVFITGALNISGSIQYPDAINFNTTSSVPLQVGGLQWDNGEGTLQLGLAGNNVALNVGEDLFLYVFNAQGTTLSKGQVVLASGSQGGRVSVKLASAIDDPNSAGTLGFVAETITAGSEGWVITEGVLKGLNTSGYTEGKLIFLSSSAGQYTETVPVAPLHGVRLGYVTKADPSQGAIFVKIDNGYEIGELHDIVDSTTTSSFGDLLVKSGSVWYTSKQLTGSYGLTGSLQADSFTGSLLGTASWAINAITASSADNFLVRGTLTAQTIVAQTITSSTDFVTGSTRFGSLLSNTHQFTGSVSVTGSLNLPNISTGNILFITSSGLVTGNNNLSWSNSDSGLTISSETATSVNRGLVIRQANTGIQAAASTFQKSRGTIASPSNVLQNDLIGAFTFSARVGGAYTSDRALFGANMATTTGIGLYFNAGNTDGTYTPSIYVHPTQNVLIGTAESILTGITDSGFRLDVSGSTRLNGNTLITGSLTVATGSSVELQVTNTGVKIGNMITDVHPVTGSINVSGSVTSSLFGTASWATNALTSSIATSSSYALTSSYVLNAVSSSFATTASYWSGSVINAESASYATLALTASYFSGSISNAISASYALTASFALNGGGGGAGTVEIADEGVSQGSAALLNFTGTGVSVSVSSNTASISISGGGGNAFPYTGSAIISGSLGITGSFFLNNSQFNSTSSATAAGTTTISSIATGSYTSVFYNYTIASASNARAGQVMGVWSGGTVRYTEVTTTDIGNTSTASFVVALSGANVNLNFTAPGVWTVKSIANLL